MLKERTLLDYSNSFGYRELNWHIFDFLSGSRSC